jgi:hypothetical protein
LFVCVLCNRNWQRLGRRQQQRHTAKRVQIHLVVTATGKTTATMTYCRACTNTLREARTRVARVRAEYPNQQDYSGVADDCTIADLLSLPE